MEAHHNEQPDKIPYMARSDSSSASSIDQQDPNTIEPTIHAPVPKRPSLPSRKSSGTIIVPRDSVAAVEPTEALLDPGDVRAMSPRRTSQDIQELGREAREELKRLVPQTHATNRLKGLF